MLGRPLGYSPLKLQTLRSLLLTVNEAGCFLKKCEEELNSPAFSEPRDKDLKDRLHYFSCLIWLEAALKQRGQFSMWARTQLENACVEDEGLRLSLAKNYEHLFNLFMSFNLSLPPFHSLPEKLAQFSIGAVGSYSSIFAAAHQDLEKYLATVWQLRQSGYLFADFLKASMDPVYQQELQQYERRGFRLSDIRQLMTRAMLPFESCRFHRKLSADQLIQETCENARQELNLYALGKKFRSFLSSPPDDREISEFLSWRQEKLSQDVQMVAEAQSRRLREKLDQFISFILDGQVTEAALRNYLDDKFYSEVALHWNIESSELLKAKVAEVIPKRAMLKREYPAGAREDFPGIDYPLRFMTARECVKEYFLSALKAAELQSLHFETIEEFLAQARQEHLALQYFLRERRIYSKIKSLSEQLLNESSKDQEELKADLSLLENIKNSRVKYWALVLLLINISEKAKFKKEENTQPIFFSKSTFIKEPLISLKTIFDLKPANFCLPELIQEYNKESSLELNASESLSLQELIKMLKSLDQSIHKVFIDSSTSTITALASAGKP